MAGFQSSPVSKRASYYVSCLRKGNIIIAGEPLVPSDLTWERFHDLACPFASLTHESFCKNHLCASVCHLRGLFPLGSDLRFTTSYGNKTRTCCVAKATQLTAVLLVAGSQVWADLRLSRGRYRISNLIAWPWATYTVRMNHGSRTRAGLYHKPAVGL